MVCFCNGLLLYLLLRFGKPSIVRSESTTTVYIVPGDKVLFNCSEYSSIIIRNVSVQNIGKCESRQTDCNLNRNDHELIKGCKGSPSCHVNGSLLTSSCLWEDLHFDLSYTCIFKASYEYVGCYVDDLYRVLEENHKNNPAMSAEICFNICTEYQTSDKYDYFGTQNGHECFCGDGDKLNSEPYIRKESECNMPCLQHTDEMCGNDFRISIYRITTLSEISSNHSCLNVDQENIIQDCKPNQLQKDSLCIRLDVFSTDKAIDESCRDQDKEIGNKLYHFCKNTKFNGNCVYNLARFLTAEIALQPPTKYISIVYACKENNSASISPRSSSIDLPTLQLLTTTVFPFVESTTHAGIPIIIASVLVVVIIAALVFIIIALYRRKQIAKNSQPSKIRQKQIKTDKIFFSDNNIGMTDINIPAIYENINDDETINREAQNITASIQQEGNYETLSTNRNSVEHMYESTEHESTEPDLIQYQSLTNPPESDIHTYATTEPDLSLYQSLTNPPEFDIHTYASTASLQ